MTLRLADRWIWDFWIVEDQGSHHAFYLQAPRSLEDPDLRHWNATIGHATSTDLVDWQPLADALSPGEPGAWDSMATWTGSVMRFENEWRMYYTGVSIAEKGLVQRIGLATSPDLVTWTKHPANPLIEADPVWYETLDAGLWKDQAWRDPWVHVTADGNLSAYITARIAQGPPDARGVIALATSADGIDWDVHAPISAPGHYASLEVPQMTIIGDRAYIIVSVAADETSAARLRDHRPLTGIHYLMSDDPSGPFEWVDAPLLAADEHGSRYSGKLLTHQDRLVLMSSLQWTAEGEYLGVLGDPEPVTVDDDGRLLLTRF